MGLKLDEIMGILWTQNSESQVGSILEYSFFPNSNVYFEKTIYIHILVYCKQGTATAIRSHFFSLILNWMSNMFKKKNSVKSFNIKDHY